MLGQCLSMSAHSMWLLAQLFSVFSMNTYDSRMYSLYLRERIIRLSVKYKGRSLLKKLEEKGFTVVVCNMAT